MSRCEGSGCIILLLQGTGGELIIKSAAGDHFPRGGSGEYDPHTMGCWHTSVS